MHRKVYKKLIPTTFNFWQQPMVQQKYGKLYHLNFQIELDEHKLLSESAMFPSRQQKRQFSKRFKFLFF
jgi:hypothetical protein